MKLTPDQQVAFLNHLAREVLKPLMPPGQGFALLLFPFEGSEDHGILSYLSNAQRPEMIKQLRETADRLEQSGK